jgi:hypothetical protein
MPNYCDCEILVRGQPADVDAFLKMGLPQAHFGAARIHAVELIERGTRRARLCFMTETGEPPLSYVTAMSEKFPALRLTLRYHDGPMGMKGVHDCKGGEVLFNLREPYKPGRTNDGRAKPRSQ